MSDESAGNAVNDIITEDMDIDSSEEKGNDTFPLAIKELGEGLFRNYPDKTANLSEENVSGLIGIAVLNDWMAKSYGYEYASLKTLAQQKKVLPISVKGYGVEKFIEIVKSIQATFQQTEMPQNLANRILRR